MNALVTGGGGFLGRAVVCRLLGRGAHVRSFSRANYPDLAAIGVVQVQGDLADQAAVLRAAEGCDIVFHVAAKAGVWGRYHDYYQANVAGTENVVSACLAHGIRKLVFTSSPSVVYHGRDQEGVDESEPYPERYAAHYPRTKAMAERFVMHSNGPELATVSLRPHLIWGPGDNHLIPRILERARTGKFRSIGNKPKLVDTIYIDNAADAHLMAADRLYVGSPIGGKTFFLSQGEPVPLWDFINRIVAVAGHPPITRHVPAGTAYVAGAILELTHRLFRRQGEPRMTRFLARQLSTAHWFDISAARRDIGYEPKVSIDEGLRRLGESLNRSEAAAAGWMVQSDSSR
jgi:nucleoside-diphosphate-sugar epimerase